MTGTEQERERESDRARQEQKRGTEQDQDRADRDSVKGIPFSAVHFHFQIQPSGTPHVNINY